MMSIYTLEFSIQYLAASRIFLCSSFSLFLFLPHCHFLSFVSLYRLFSPTEFIDIFLMGKLEGL